MGGCCLPLGYPSGPVTHYQESMVSGQFCFKGITKCNSSVYVKSRPMARQTAAGSPESGAAQHAWACSLRKLQVCTGETEGYGAPTLLKQLAIPALKALNNIKNTGQTSAGFRTRRV